jgi:hypothetical protein
MRRAGHNPQRGMAGFGISNDFHDRGLSMT